MRLMSSRRARWGHEIARHRNQMLESFRQLESGHSEGTLDGLSTRISWPVLRLVTELVWNSRYGRCQRTYEPGDSSSVMMLIGTLGPGGAEKQFALLAIELAQRGKVVTAVVNSLVPDSNAFHKDSLTKQGIRVIDLGDLLNDRSCSRLARIWRTLTPFPEDVNAYRKLIREEQPAAVHCWLDTTNTVAGTAAMLAGAPKIVLSIRSLPPYHFAFHQWFFWPAYRRLLKRRSVTLVSNSRTGAEGYLTWLKMRPKRPFHVVRNICEQEGVSDPNSAGTSSTASSPAEPILVGGILRFSREKRPELWLETARLLATRHSHLKFQILGAGPLLDECRSRVKSWGLQDRIDLPGIVHNPNEYLSKFALLLLTSAQEGLPNVLLEAQAAGVPIVSTDVGGVAECVEPGITARLVDANTGSRGLAEEVEFALLDESWLKDARATGPQFTRKSFAAASIVPEWLSIYAGGSHENWSAK